MPSDKMPLVLKVLDILRRLYTLTEENHEVKIITPRLIAHALIKETTINEFKEAIEEAQSFTVC